VKWLLLDATYLCHVARHTTGGMVYNDRPTGVVFGVIRAIDMVTDLWGCDRAVFAFDAGGGGHRRELVPDYKAHRNKDLTEEEEEELKSFYGEVRDLGRNVLPEMGYRNIFRRRGFEADDILAAVAEEIPLKDSAVIVTGDNDLWQCLRENVSWYSPRSKKAVTAESFKREWRISPQQWAHVKAWAGCKSDNVEGVEGIGEKTAIKWLKNELKETTKAYKAISSNLSVFNRNLPLVTLPFPGLNCPADFKDDEVTPQKVNRVLGELGITTRSFRSSQKGDRVRGFDI